MGTRNLTCVYLDGQYKIAQYGQWDGYPEGQGATCLEFLREKMNLPLFKERLRAVSFIDKDKIHKIFTAFGGKENGIISMEDHDKLYQVFPEFHRDTGAKILEMVQNDELLTPYVVNDLDFAANSLWCEWCYVVDFDKNTFEVYCGFNTEPLTEDDRFFFLADKEDLESKGSDGKQFHGVKLAKSYDLNNLPTEEEFFADFKGDEDE